MLDMDRCSQFLKFLSLFQWSAEQERSYARRLAVKLQHSADPEKDFILWSDRNWKHFLVSSKQNSKMGNFVSWVVREPQEETAIVFWHQIMKLPEKQICAALNLSSGTFKFRLSRGLCSLGKCL